MSSRSIIFMGSPDFAVASLKAICESGIEIKAVVTQPDKERGRGKKVSFTPVKQAALELEIPVLQPVKMKDPDFTDKLNELNAGLFVVVAFRILPKAVLDIPPLGSVNLHASLLPEYRGAAPINHALFNGDTETGLTVFFLNAGKVDSGDIIRQQKIRIEDDENFGSLYNKLKTAGAGLLPDVICNIFSGTFKTEQQDLSNVKNISAPKIFPEDFVIDWELQSKSVHDKVRGLSPRPGAFSTLNGKRIKFIKSTFESATHSYKPGYVSGVDKKSGMIRIACGEGFLIPLEVQPEGKPVMPVQAYLNGYGLKKGDVFI